ncbi:FAD-dependent oxidoreductase [Aeromonas salmonicida]|uniref:Nitric oxide reductase FlRd-NAD(+) reductase n=1 Tax=Aeromonas salmonicida subsp. pectinolytica 34mel TaxID=1324960 RepID=T0PK68_AERSA|nr:NADH:flavorubredoxin reductase NorW [Aeromonas salmonicida]ATP11500.1 nitric-oxide-reductase rubredoxin reductase [Aeromonas salmonicida subsp. pectinolytica 34mel]EQC04422.1 NADH:flavorubredoxin oxidoreductase [Aeromonas salmonicida subsp. pectinolytica 34mel]TNI19223.1 FAD-dependent oxidoreductase [Aeromonas salmonicida]HEH9415316.1 NADH:flavorubredoxin reductase NorW [Aeromonas salmonicida]HEH9424132.1 NADH:flavorubredoxin reductase NorW [Aeromonas salmonicida]
MKAATLSEAGVSREILVIGSGFAAQQLVKSLRKLDAEQPIRLITADSGVEYNKPDLSHVVSRGCTAAAMTRLSGSDFAEQQHIALLPHCPVLGIDPARRIVMTGQGEFAYGQLVLATGASAARPDLPGSEQLVTLNSQQEYAAAEGPIQQARRIMVLGAGLIGCELAMDMASDGREVTLVDLADSPLSALLPAVLSQPLQQALRSQGVKLQLGQGIAELSLLDPDRPQGGWRVTLSNGRVSEQDLVIAAIGLKPNLVLAQAAGLAVERGILVDDSLQTSAPHIFALGDCAQWRGQLLPFLQPIVLGANALARTLLGMPTPLTLPPMLVKVKTPRYPLQLAGRTKGEDLTWQCRWNSQGMVAEAHGEDGELCGFVVGGDQMSAAFPLLRQLPR